MIIRFDENGNMTTFTNDSKVFTAYIRRICSYLSTLAANVNVQWLRDRSRGR